MAASAISLAVSIGLNQLAQHTARLQDATDENQALDALVPAFDQDIKEIVNYFNAGNISASEAVTALTQVDSNCYNYLRAQVGKPGTAWSAGYASKACNKSCTAGCCVYYNDLHSAIHGPDPAVNGGAVMDGATGLIPGINAGYGGDPVYKGQCYVPTISAPPNTAYGTYSRAGYHLAVQKPPANPNVAKAILTVVGTGTNTTVVATKAPPAPTTVATPPTAATTTPAPATGGTPTTALGDLINKLTGTEVVTIVGLIGGMLLIITALFGTNAVRVNQ